MSEQVSQEASTVLLVEDGREHRQKLEAYLNQDKYRILHAESYDDALQILECEPVSLVIIDQHIAGQSGLQLCVKIRQTDHTREVPVVMLFSDDEDFRKHGYDAGADDFISKPVTRDQLRARVRTITRLNRYRLLHDSNQLLQAQQRQLSKLMSFDAITGLANLSTFKESLQGEVERAQRAGYAIAIIAICAHEFDRVLGVYGEDEADKLARQIANRLSAAAKGRGLVGRIDSRNFIVYKPIPREEDLLPAVQQYRRRFDDSFSINGDHINISSSIGASAFPCDAGDTNKLVSLAVSAMTLASNSGRNRYHVYAAGAHEDVKRQLHLESQIKRALDNEHLEMYYQPSIQLTDGKVRKMEGLMRMRDDDGNFIPPSIFLPVAQDCGLMKKMGFGPCIALAVTPLCLKAKVTLMCVSV